jgi:hypothetical protein
VLRGLAVTGHDTRVELEAGEGDFVVTPAMARLLVRLARERLERERGRRDSSVIMEEDRA